MILLALLLLQAAPLQELSVQGAKAMREGRFQEAERIYRDMIRQAPTEPRLRLNLALALHSGRKYAEAIPEFERFLRAMPAPGPAHLMLGLSRLKMKQFCEAIPPLEKARLWQANAQNLTELADANAGCRRFAAAARAYRDAARLDPNNPALPRAAARAFWQAREYVEARPLFAALEPKFREDAQFLYEYGDTLARLEGVEMGLPLLEKAVARQPDLLPARGELGRNLVEAGRALEGIPHLEAAAPIDATLLLPLSRAYKAAGRVQDAARVEAEYRRSVAQN